ncbi:ribonuclease HIII [Desulfurobacterium atlanticum]|uniref:Ribonuclease n=1 Tax=Desulfurobacterium atlanticum TaxID=240169 RepID=A0A238Y024_9BACT|nr:ribonuclease HIII [Desulfurobacterium atlanticum]SNR64656.1 ribonuclease HIII [Desulfurobacterium atlanticum]
MGRFKETEIEKIVEKLKQCGAVFEPPPKHASYRIRLGDGILTIYSSGSLVYGGKDKERLKNIVMKVLSSSIDKTPRVGCDEAGKGEYVGPLVVSAVFADEFGIDKLLRLGVKDSKKLSDKKVLELSEKIREKVNGKVKILMPKSYNILYSKFKNLNKLLDYVYCELLKDLYRKFKFKKVVIDKYDNTLESELRKIFPKNMDIVVVNRAEDDPVVAAASIVARAERLRRMELLEKKYGISLPKGNKPEEIDTFLNNVPEELLPELVKTHFNIKRGDQG